MMHDDSNNDLLPTQLLQEYIDNFYGYGCWSTSKFWFIGIEEGGGNTKKDIQLRLKSWEKQGKTDLMDCKMHHINTGSFTTDPLLKMHSRTWTRLIIAKLGFQSIPRAPEAMLNLLNNEWGQLSSDNLLVELFPLPSPGVKDWYYPCWVDLKSDLYFLEDRQLYKAKVIDQRISNIKSKIAQYQPEVVLFYGKSMQNHWDAIIGTDQLYTFDILEKERNRIRYKKIGNTYFIQCPQPTFIRGYKFWTELGKYIRTLVNKKD